MTPRQRKFCDEYLISGNATDAAIKAGYSPKTANHISKDADLDGIMDAWANDFAEKLEVSEEGVHE